MLLIVRLNYLSGMPLSGPRGQELFAWALGMKHACLAKWNRDRQGAPCVLRPVGPRVHYR